VGMTRSQQMATVRQADTAPELEIRRNLWRRGLRYRVGARTPGGRPDLVFPRQRVAVFIDGCFWHGCPEHYVRPRTQEAFWCDKLRSNFERDRRQTRVLLEHGWRVLRFWEHEAQQDCQGVCESIAAVVRGESTGRSHRRVVSVILVDQISDRERRTVEDLLDAAFSEITDGPRMSRAGGPARRRRLL
jgi:DNA mismatch endonuclease (patch repair protein)